LLITETLCVDSQYQFKNNAMKTQDIIKFVQARERQLWDEYVESRDVNGNLHAVTKRQYDVWREVNDLLNYITK